MMYIIYGKSPTCKRFSPLGSDRLVNRLIHAVVYTDKIQVDKICVFLNEDNKNWQFEVRKK